MFGEIECQKITRTMVLEERDEPPRFARAGAVRWMRRNVVMNGVEPCDSFVRYERRFWRRELEFVFRGVEDIVGRGHKQ